MRITNTAHATKRTRHLYDAEVMGDEYDPPGITFSRESGVARVKQDVGEALVAKYPHLEPVEDSTPDESSDSDASDGAGAEGEADDGDSDTDSESE